MSSTDTVPLQPLAIGGHKCTKNEECGEGTCSKFKCHCRDGFVGPTCLVRIIIVFISFLLYFYPSLFFFLNSCSLRTYSRPTLSYAIVTHTDKHTHDLSHTLLHSSCKHTLLHRLRMDSMILNGRKNKISHCLECSYLLLLY